MLIGSAIASVLFSWLWFGGVALALRWGSRSLDLGFSLGFWLSLCGTALSFALERGPRFRTLTAGLVMLLLWFLTTEI